MVQGVSSSLNMALARISYIENSFSALEKLSAQTSQETTSVDEFKKILDKKELSGKVQETKEEKVEKTTEKKEELPKIDKDIKKEKQSELDKIAETNAKCVAGYQAIRKVVYNNISDGDLTKMNKYIKAE